MRSSGKYVDLPQNERRVAAGVPRRLAAGGNLADSTWPRALVIAALGRRVAFDLANSFNAGL